MKCRRCGQPLTGRQTAYCSRRCSSQAWNEEHYIPAAKTRAKHPPDPRRGIRPRLSEEASENLRVLAAFINMSPSKMLEDLIFAINQEHAERQRAAQLLERAHEKELN